MQEKVNHLLGLKPGGCWPIILNYYLLSINISQGPSRVS